MNKGVNRSLLGTAKDNPDEHAESAAAGVERRPAWRGRRHDFPISCSHVEPFMNAPILATLHSMSDPLGAAPRSLETCPFGMQDGHRLCPDLPETFEA